METGCDWRLPCLVPVQALQDATGTKNIDCNKRTGTCTKNIDCNKRTGTCTKNIELTSMQVHVTAHARTPCVSTASQQFKICQRTKKKRKKIAPETRTREKCIQNNFSSLAMSVNLPYLDQHVCKLKTFHFHATFLVTKE